MHHADAAPASVGVGLLISAPVTDSMDAQDVAQMYKPTDLQIYRHIDDIEERI